ncbi:hypothetical protein H0A36_13815 [Endozoicomonas sp. SM1973]|uniref:Uncharacterized protein n=1 Tax=Spartinivicinus marinus TaxID=2994442 RepID=A0A853I651_9GAMM|nr:hypothetical protein [Spartinivicinus marinus]MCX4028641.1 hypothetical protein [Spartinivicinus marinus]NYZ67092.1 hypothetical protein [Spartinivicinus marinus]
MMMKTILTWLTGFQIILAALSQVSYANSQLSADFLSKIGKCSAPNRILATTPPVDLTDLTGGDPFYYTSNQTPRPSTTHSKIPHLPVYFGYMSTNNTYRFVNIVEQVFTMIGEGKHGLWRVQDNGMIREYRKAGAKGIPQNADIFDKKYLTTLTESYSHYLPDESWSGYKLPQDKVDESGYLKYIDLPINHPKYQSRYDSHQPIDLPHWYCTMSDFQFPYAKKAMEFAFTQPAANKAGPLGKRAGLDINENYTNILRLKLFEDARTWVNTGTANEVDWQAIDTNKTKAEFYLVERPFFNEKYLFLTAVFDNKTNQDFSYIRPNGPYYEHLVASGERRLKTQVTQQPRFHLANAHRTQTGKKKIVSATGTHLYGVHHPDRAAFNGGGACPMKGGDWAEYPKTSGGAGWPTNYEEVTPLCDAVLIDIKLTTNLDGETWNDPTKYLGNAGHGSLTVDYKINPEGFYGEFVDPYHVKRGVTNPAATYIGPVETLHYKTVREPVRYTPVKQ